jgi:transposase
MEPSTPPGPEFNEAARYAMLLNQAGKSLDLGPSISKGPAGFHLAKEETDEDVLRYYEEDMTQGIDLSRPDWEEHWNAIKRGYGKRVTDYGQLLADAGGEIAAIPGNLIEGIAEDGLVKGIASTGEGVVRSIRDLWGMAAESENPTSLLFGFKSVIKGLMSGKPSSNAYEEAQQWNQARKFNYHSMRMMQGDESVLEQYIDMDEETAKKVRSFINPKVAHAMSFIGMELPSIIAAPFTGGASAELAVAAAGKKAAEAAMLANRANMFSKIGNTLASSASRFDNFAQKITQRTVGGVAYGLGKALEVPANIAGAALGGTLDNLASRTGFSSGYLRNAAETAATDASVALGGVAGGARQTVGLLGSLGLRTTSELLQEIGNKAMMRSFGVIEAGTPTSLSILESVAANQLLSPSARVGAKMLNTVVDPMIQLSTASLKHAYKDALTFSFLGYLSDRERGAVGGAAQGLMWGGYSGALRHSWSLVNGGLSHEIHIKNFDEGYVSQVEKINPDYASFIRQATTYSDASKSTRAMSNTRTVAQILWQSLDAADKKNLITHIGDSESLAAHLISKGVDPRDALHKTANGSGGMVHFVRKSGKDGGVVPLLFLNRKRHRLQDFSHENVGHLVTYSLREKGKLGEHLRKYFGDKADGGIFSDEIIATKAARRRSLELALEQVSADLPNDERIKEVNKRAKEIFEGLNTDREGSKAYYLRALQELRFRANNSSSGSAAFWLHSEPNAQGMQTPAAYAAHEGVKFMFEEAIGGEAESLFIHTNMQDLVLTDEMKPFRVNIERIYNERFARKTTDIEMAGVRAKYGDFVIDDPNNKAMHGKYTIQAEAYDDGVWRRAPEFDQLIKSMVRDAISHDAQSVNKLSPAQQLAEAKLHRKEFLFNITKAGATMKGTKELNDMATKSAADAFEVFKGLDDSIRPEIVLDEHGNQSVDMLRIKDDALNAMEAAGAIDPETARSVKVIRDAYTQWESSGFATSNIFTGTYWGDSQRTIKNGYFQRLFGNDVSVSHRVFVPFEMKLTLKTTDGAGKQLRQPRGGMLMTVVDYMAIHRRKMKMWSRPDVRNTFVSLSTFNNAFDEYLVNMMKDAGSRVPSAELFNRRFPGQGEKVRDMLYETFGGSIRKDESYINSPREGYSSSHENPNYPIHSMKMELLVGLELTAGKPMPYHHGRSYEGLRRNYSIAGFEKVNMSDNRLVNGQGYEVIKTGTKWKVFSPFGGIVGMFADFAKAAKAVDKDLAKHDLADLMPKPTEMEWADMTRSQKLQYMSDVGRVTHQTYTQRLLEGKGKAMNSLASLDPDSDAVFVPKYRGTYSRIKSLFYKKDEKGNIKIGPIKIHEMLSDESIKSLKAWNESNKTEGFDPGLITVIPSESGSRAFGPVHKHTGLFYTAQFDGKHQGVVVHIDLNAIEGFAETEEGRTKLIEAAAEEAIERFSAFHSPHGALIALSYNTLNAIKSDEPVNGYANLANAIKFKLRSPDFTAFKKAEVGRMKADLINAFGKNGYLQDTAPNGESLRKLLSESTAKEFKTKMSSGKHGLTGDELRVAKKIQNLSANRAEWFNENYGAIANGVIAVNDILKEMAYGDEANWIEVPNLRGGFDWAYSFTKESDAIKVDEGIKALAKITKNEDASMAAIALFKNPLHALVQVVDSSGLSKDVSVLDKTFDSSSSFISAKYTFEQLGIATKRPVNILHNNGRMSLVSESGFIATTAAKGELIDRAGVAGKTEIIKPGSQPKGAMRNTEFLAPHSALVRYKLESDANKLLPKDVENLVHFGALEAIVLGMHPELDGKFTEYRSVFESSPKDVKDRLRLSESMLREVVENGDKALIGVAMAVHSIEKAREPSERIASLGRLPEGVDEAVLSMRFMDEALANWTLQMQNFSVLGNKFEDGLNSIMGRKYYAMFKMSGVDTSKVQAIVKKIRQYHKVPEKFFEQQRGAEKTMNSIADISGISKEHKEELSKLGLLKRVTIKGISTEIFELSDRDSFVDYSSSGGEPHMLPFANSPDSQKAFSDYQQEVQRRFNTPGLEVFMPRDQILGSTKLGKVFGHTLLYKYFPWLKDVDVNFVDMHGAQAGRRSDGTYIINIGARALAYEKLGLPPEADKFRIDNETLTSRYSGSNYITGLFVHEIQHILQRAGNILEEHRSIQGLNAEDVKASFGRLLGIQKQVVLGYGDMKYGGAMAAAKIIQNFVDHPDAPVIASLRLHAKPLMKTATRNMMEFVTFEHTAGRISDELYRKAEALHKEASNIDTIEDAYKVFKSFDQFKEAVADMSPRYIPVMAENKEFRAALDAMGMVSSYDDIIKGHPDGRAVALAKAFRHYRNMEYVIEPVERQAFTTMQRRALSQEELAIKDRALAENSSVLEIIDASMNTAGVRARELGGSTLMNSIASIDADPADNPASAALGFMSVVRFFMGKANEELEQLGRHVIQQEGWEIDDNGRMVLTSARYIVKGNYQKIRDAFVAKNRGQDVPSYGDPNSQFLGMPESKGATGKPRTYTIKEFAELANFVIESEDVLSVGNSVIDIVNSDRFPPMVLGGEIRSELTKLGVFKEEAAKAVMLDSIDSRMKDMVLTKNDLLNLLAFNHVTFSQSAVTSGIGAVPDMRNRTISPADFRKVYRQSGTSGSHEVYSALTAGMGDTSPARGNASEMEIGRFKWTANKLSFALVRPSWCPDNVWREFRDRFDRSSFVQRIPKVLIGPDQVTALNDRMQRAALMIGPVVKAAAAKIEKLASEDRQLSRRLYAILLKDVEEATLRIAVGAEANPISMRDDTLGNIGNVFESVSGSPSTAQQRFGLEASNPSVFGARSGQRTVGISGWVPTMLGALFGPYIHHASESLAIASADTSEVIRPGANMNPVMATRAVNEGMDNMNMAAAYHDPLSVPQEELLVMPYKFTRDGTFGELKRGFEASIGDLNGNVMYLQSLLADVERIIRNEDDIVDLDLDDLDTYFQDVGDDRFDGNGVNAIKNMSVNERIAFMEPIRVDMAERISKLQAQEALISKVYEVWEDALMASDAADVSVYKKKLTSQLSIDIIDMLSSDRTKTRGLSLTGVFGSIAPDGKAIISLDPDNADVTGMQSFPIHVTGRGIPMEALTLYNRSFHNLENTTNHALFSLLRPKTFMLSDAHANPERFKAGLEASVGGYERAEVLVEYLEKYASTTKSTAVSLSNGPMAYYLGGNVLAVQSVMGLLMLENPDKNNGSGHIQSQLPRIMSILGQENAAMAAPVISNNKATIFSSESAVHVTNATLGAVAMPGLLGKLEAGIPHVTSDGRVMLTNFGFFNEMLPVVTEAINRGASKEEIALVAKDWIRGIDKEGISMLAHEMSSQMGSSGILTLLGLVAGVDFSKRNQLPANFGYSARSALNFGSAMGLDHLMGQHSALSTKVDKIGTGHLSVELARLMEGAMSDESGEFWIGMAVSMQAMRDKRAKAYPLAQTGKYNSRPYQARNVNRMDSSILSNTGEYLEFPAPMYGARLSTYRHDPTITPGLSNGSWEGVGVYLDTAYGPSPAEKYSPSSQRLEWTMFGQGEYLDLVENRSPEVMQDALEGTTVYDAINQAKYNTREHLTQVGVFAEDDNGTLMLKAHDGNRNYTDENYVVGGSGAGSINTPSVGTVVKSAIKRSLITNRIASVAKQLGKTEVSTPAARFNLTVAPSPGMLSIKAREDRSTLWMGRKSYIAKVMGGAGTTGLHQQLHSKDYGKVGISWKRLEDGRIMVNFSPDISIAATYDIVHDSDIQSPAVGIPLLRAVGWDANSGTAFSQSMARRAVFGVGKTSGAYAKEQAPFLNIGKRYGGFDDVAVRDYLKGMQKLLGGDIYLGGRTHNKFTGGAGLRPRYVRELGSNVRANLSKIVEGNIPTGIEDAMSLVAYADEAMHDISQDHAYVTFILPADAKIEDFNTAILNTYAAAMAAQGPYAKTRALPAFMGIDGPVLSTHVGRITDINDDRALHRRLLETMREGMEVEESVNPSLQLRGMQAALGSSSGGSITTMMEQAARSIQAVNPNFHGDISAAFHRMMTGESGYYLPDSERSLAMYGERSAAIELMFPGRTDLKHHSWDTSESLNLTVFKNAQKRYTIAWNEFGPIGEDGKRQVKRIIRNFDTESEANAMADKISAGNIQAEVAKATPNRDSLRVESAGTAKGLSAQVQQSARISLEEGPQGEAGNHLWNGGKTWGVGNLGKAFDTQEAAKAAANLLRQGDVLTMEAPKQERISLSLADHSQSELERILRHRSTFAIGGSPIQFVSKMVNALIKGMDKNKRVKDVRTGLEWFDLLMANTVSKNELRSTGMAEFLYANRNNNLTKKELFDYLYVFYPQQGRTVWQPRYDKLTQQEQTRSIRNPHNIDFVASKMLYASRTLKMVQMMFGGLDHALVKATDDATPAMQTAIQTLKDMHLAALTDAYEKVMNKDTITSLIKELGLEGQESGAVVLRILNELQTNPDRILQFSAPLLETYRLNLNTAVSKAKMETLAALQGIELEIGDPVTMDSTQLTNAGLALSDWDAAIEEYYDKTHGPQGDYGYTKGGDHGYAGYTSGIGEHVYTALFTEVAPREEDFRKYIDGLTKAKDLAADPAEKAKYQSAIDAAYHVYKVRKAIADNYSRSSTHHKGAPSGKGYNLLGHLRVTDATVPTAVPVLSTPGSIFEQLKSYNRERLEQAQIPVAFIEELQSDTYQRKTFGPNLSSDYTLYATFKELEELPGLRAQVQEVTDKLQALQISENSKAGYLQGFTGGSSSRYVLLNYFLGAYARHEVTTAGPFTRYMVSQMSQGSEWKPSGKMIPVPKALQDNYGLPASIPDVYPDGPLSRETLLKFRSSTMHPVESMNAEVIRTFLAPGNLAIPGFGTLKFGNFVYHGNTDKSISGLAKYFLAMSPEFVAIARELAQESLNDPTAVEKLLGKFDFDLLARNWSAKIRALSTNQEVRDAFIRQYGDSKGTRQHFNRMVQLGNILETMSTIDSEEAAFQVRSVRFEPESENTTKFVRLDPDNPSFDRKFIDRKQVFAVSEEQNIVEFIDKLGARIGQAPINPSSLKPLLAKYKLHKDKVLKSPRGIVSTMLAFVAEALEVEQEKVAEAMLNGDPTAGSVNITPADIVEFAHGRTKLNDKLEVLRWLDELTDNNYDARHEFVRRFGSMFRATDYENDPASQRISNMRDVFQHNAKSVMGKMMEAMAGPIAVLWNSYNGTDEVAKLRERQADLAKKAGLKLDEDGDIVTYNLPDSIPHGEDNAYRPILVNTYVMNALAKRQRALVIADARHHRARYGSTGYVNHAINLGGGRIMMLSSRSQDLSHAAYILDVVRKRGLFNNLIERIRRENIHFGDQVEIDGTGKSLGSWLIEAGNQVIDEFPEAFSGERNRATEKREFGLAIEYIARMWKSEGGSEQSMMATFENFSDKEDMMKRMGKMRDAPEGLLVSLPFDKTHGYAVNYGAPGWLNEYYYAGNPRKAIEAVSHDAFEKASVAMANDKTYVVLAPNGKVLFEKIATLEEAEERAAQSSRYLGSVPHLTVFLKQYGRIGAYVMEAFMQSNLGNERHPALRMMKEDNRGTESWRGIEDIVEGAGLASFSKGDWNSGKYDEAFLGPYDTDTNPSSHLPENAAMLAKDRGRNANPEAMGPPHIPSGNITWKAPIPLQLHAMGITKLSSHDEVAAGMARIAGFTGPMMVIKPKFPTSMHASEMAKLIVEGISLMSLADMTPEGRQKVAMDIHRWYTSPINSSTAKGGRPRDESRRQLIGRALEEAMIQNKPLSQIAKEYGLSQGDVSAWVHKLRSEGIQFPRTAKRMEGEKYVEMGKDKFKGAVPLEQGVVNQIRELRGGGMTYKEIAKALGISTGSVQRYVNRDIDYRPDRADPTEPYGGPHA